MIISITISWSEFLILMLILAFIGLMIAFVYALVFVIMVYQKYKKEGKMNYKKMIFLIFLVPILMFLILVFRGGFPYFLFDY